MVNSGLDDWHLCSQLYGDPSLLPSLLERQRHASPDAVALVFGAQRVTYAELHNMADRLAAELVSQGVRPSDLVGVCAERSIELVVALLGIVKSGAVYLPLDPTLPSDRLGFMLEDAKSPLVLTQSHLTQAQDAMSVRTWTLEQFTEPSDKDHPEPPLPRLGPTDLMYCIYTSGSTGRPKGVLNTHAGVTNRLQWMQKAYALTSTDVVLQKTPFSFDVSVWEFFWPLMVGARMVIARPEGHKDPFYLKELIEREGVTTMHFVPSMLQAFLETLPSAWHSPLRQVFCSGEALSKPVVLRFFERVPGVALHNLYGPTEAAVDVSFFDCRDAVDRPCVPIGKPIANIELLVLDDRLREVDPGEEGELHIGGIGLAQGYLARPELTAERFIAHPDGPPGRRLYKTGDLARVLPDGNIEYLGRLDHQVKIRGLRIELGEIESCLLSIPHVRDAAVVTAERASQTALFGFLVSSGQDRLDLSDLQRQLATQLPDYMIPAFWHVLEEMPLSSNGKVDRKSLMALAITCLQSTDASELATADVAWQNAIESSLAALWAQCFPDTRVHRQADFKRLGGTSLTAIRLSAAITRDMGREIRPADLLLHTGFVAQSKWVSTAPLAVVDIGQVSNAPEAVFDFTRGQADLLLAHDLDTSGCAYWVHAGVHMPSALGEHDIRSAWEAVARKHPMLRARARYTSGHWHGVIAPRLAEGWWERSEGEAPELHDLQCPDEVLSRINAPRDLWRDGVFKVHWWPRDAACVTGALMVITIHHAFADEASVDLLLRELDVALSNHPLGQPSAQALALAATEDQHLPSAHQMDEEALRLGIHFHDRTSLLPQPPAPGREQVVHLPPSHVNVLMQTAQRLGCSAFPLLLLAMGSALEDCFGNAAALIATPFSRRADARLADVVAYWLDVRLLDLRARPGDNLGTRLARLMPQIHRAMGTSFMPISGLAERLSKAGHRDLSNSLMQFGMTWREHPTRQLPMGNGQARLLRLPQVGARYGLCLHAANTADGLKFSIEHVQAAGVEVAVEQFWSAFCRRVGDLTQLAALDQLAGPNSAHHVNVPDGLAAQEAILRQCWAESTGVPLQAVHAASQWFQDGGTSLTAIRMAAALQVQLGCRLDLSLFFQRPTYGALPNCLVRLRKPWPQWCVGLGSTEAQHLHIVIPGQGGHAEGLMSLADGLRSQMLEDEAVVVVDVDGVLQGLPLTDDSSAADWILDELHRRLLELPGVHIQSITGFSMSGVLALSLAARLGHATRAPEVFLLDALGPRHFRTGRGRALEWSLSRRLSRWRSWWHRSAHLAPVDKGEEIKRKASPQQWKSLVADLHRVQVASPHVHVHFLRATKTTDHFGMVWRRLTNGFRPRDFASWHQVDLDAAHLDLGRHRVPDVVKFIMAQIRLSRNKSANMS
jgi:amino acid adenylation domain-containing protein